MFMSIRFRTFISSIKYIIHDAKEKSLPIIQYTKGSNLDGVTATYPPFDLGKTNGFDSP